MWAGGTRCNRLRPAARPVGSDPGAARPVKSEASEDESRKVDAAAAVGGDCDDTPLSCAAEGRTGPPENEAEYRPYVAPDDTAIGATSCGLLCWVDGDCGGCGGGRTPLNAEDSKEAVVGDTTRPALLIVGGTAATRVASRVRLCARSEPFRGGLDEPIGGHSDGDMADIERAPSEGTGIAVLSTSAAEEAVGEPVARRRSAGTEFDMRSKAFRLDTLDGP